MCQKRQQRCTALLAIRDAAMDEWTKAETFEEVRLAWSRLGGRVTLHRYGSEHFRRLALSRHERSKA